MDGNGADHQTEHVHDFVQRSEPVDAIAPVREPRNFAGWILLAFLFTLLILPGMLVSLSKRDKSSANEFLTQEVTLRGILRQKELFSMVGLGNFGGQSSNEIENLADDLAPKALTNPAATRLYLAASHEAKKKVEPKYLAFLLSQGNQADRAFSRLYATEQLPKGAAERLLPELKGDSLAMQLARVHAREKAGISPSGREEIAPLWKSVGMLVISGGAILLLGLSLLVWVAYFSMRANGQIKPLGLPPNPISLLDADRFAMLAGVILTAFMLLSQLGGSVAVRFPDIPQALFSLIPSIGILLFIFAVQSLPIWGKPVRLSAIGIKGEKFGKHLLWGAAGFVAELPLMGFMGWLGQKVFFFLPPPEHPASTMLQNSPALIVVACVLIFGAMIAPFWEEIAFRGLMLPAVTRITSGRIVAGTLITSFLFAAIHPQGLSTWPALMTVAAMSCALAYHTKSLVPSVIMHALHNMTLLTITLILF